MNKFNTLTGIMSFVGSVVIVLQFVLDRLATPTSIASQSVFEWLTTPFLTPSEVLGIALLLGGVALRLDRRRQKKRLDDLQRQVSTNRNEALSPANPEFVSAFKYRSDIRDGNVEELVKETIGASSPREDTQILNAIIVHKKKTPREVSEYTGIRTDVVVDRVAVMKAKGILSSAIET